MLIINSQNEDDGELYPELSLKHSSTDSKERDGSFGFINFQEIAVNRRQTMERLALLNLASYLIEIATLSIIIWSGAQGNIFNSQQYNSPLALNNKLKNVAWVAVFLLKGVFAFLPLLNTESEFDDIVIDKIKYSYSMLCLILSAGIVCLCIEGLRIYFVATIVFFLLKIYCYYEVYTKINYHDDGACFVSRAEFF